MHSHTLTLSIMHSAWQTIINPRWSLRERIRSFISFYVTYLEAASKCPRFDHSPLVYSSLTLVPNGEKGSSGNVSDRRSWKICAAITDIKDITEATYSCFWFSAMNELMGMSHKPTVARALLLQWANGVQEVHLRDKSLQIGFQNWTNLH